MAVQTELPITPPEEGKIQKALIEVLVQDPEFRKLWIDKLNSLRVNLADQNPNTNPKVQVIDADINNLRQTNFRLSDVSSLSFSAKRALYLALYDYLVTNASQKNELENLASQLTALLTEADSDVATATVTDNPSVAQNQLENPNSNTQGLEYDSEYRQKIGKILKLIRAINSSLEVQNSILEIYNLPHWVDLDLLSELIQALKIGLIDGNEFTEALSQQGLSHLTIQNWLKQARGYLSESFTDKRLEIVLNCQSPYPQQQAVAEAVSNAIDATRKKVETTLPSIGQWGRGIKMLLNYLTDPRDRIMVTTNKNGQSWQIEIRRKEVKTHNNHITSRFYLRARQVLDGDSNQSTGTVVIVNKTEPLEEEFIKQLESRLTDRFRFVESVQIECNGKSINTQAQTWGATATPLPSQTMLGMVRVAINPTEIRIEDNGCGMDPDELLAMFIPDAGSKTFVSITPELRKSLLSEIKVLQDFHSQNQVHFVRYGEKIRTLGLPEESRLNLCPRGIVLDLGRLLETSDARESFIINDNFAEAMKKVLTLVVDNKNLNLLEKVTILNTLVSCLGVLGGEQKEDKKLSTYHTIYSIVEYASTIFSPLRHQLTSEGYTLIPNYPEFASLQIAADSKTIPVDPRLFNFDPSKQIVAGFTEVPANVFRSPSGEKLFLAGFKPGEERVIIRYNNGFILDKEIWEKLMQQYQKPEGMEDAVVLRIILELLLNPVSTGYDPHEEPFDPNRNHLVTKPLVATTRATSIAVEPESIAQVSDDEFGPQWPDWLGEEDIKNILDTLNTREIIKNTLRNVKIIRTLNSNKIFALQRVACGYSSDSWNLYEIDNGQLVKIQTNLFETAPRANVKVYEITAEGALLKIDQNDQQTFYYLNINTRQISPVRFVGMSGEDTSIISHIFHLRYNLCCNNLAVLKLLVKDSVNDPHTKEVYALFDANTCQLSKLNSEKIEIAPIGDTWPILLAEIESGALLVFLNSFIASHNKYVYLDVGTQKLTELSGKIYGVEKYNADTVWSQELPVSWFLIKIDSAPSDDDTPFEISGYYCLDTETKKIQRILSHSFYYEVLGQNENGALFMERFRGNVNFFYFDAKTKKLTELNHNLGLQFDRIYSLATMPPGVLLKIITNSDQEKYIFFDSEKKELIEVNLTNLISEQEQISQIYLLTAIPSLVLLKILTNTNQKKYVFFNAKKKQFVEIFLMKETESLTDEVSVKPLLNTSTGCLIQLSTKSGIRYVYFNADSQTINPIKFENIGIDPERIYSVYGNKEIDGKNTGLIFNIHMTSDIDRGGSGFRTIYFDYRTGKLSEISSVPDTTVMSLDDNRLLATYAKYLPEEKETEIVIIEYSPFSFEVDKQALTELLDMLHQLHPYPQIIIQVLKQFLYSNKPEKIGNLPNIVKAMQDHSFMCDFFQNLEENTVGSNELNNRYRNELLTTAMTNVLEIYFQLGTTSDPEEAKFFLKTLNDLTKDNRLLLLIDLTLIDCRLPENRALISKLLKLIPENYNLLEWCSYFNLINAFFQVKTNTTERNRMLDKLQTILKNKNYTQILQRICSSFSRKELVELFSAEYLPRYNPGVSILEYLRQEHALSLESETVEAPLGKTVFENTVPLARILYEAYNSKPGTSWLDIENRIADSPTNEDLKFFEGKILKEIRGQAAETGVSGREMLQNAIDAIRNRRDITQGSIQIRLFETNLFEQNIGSRWYFVEEIQDNGTGILDWLKFFVPGLTTKNEEDLGRFGSGFFTVFRDVDMVEIMSSKSDGKGYYFLIKLINDQPVIVDSCYLDDAEMPQGTTIRRYKKVTDDLIPELEAAIAIDDYLANAGLVKVGYTDSQGKDLRITINNTEVDPQALVRISEEFEYEGINYGPIKLVQSELPPTLAHGVGLRMSDLDDRYLQYVPKGLVSLFRERKISIILPKGLSLIKDRSRIANEEVLLDALLRKIGSLAIKLAVQELILGYQQRTQSRQNYRIWKPPGFPDDWFTNPLYSRIYAPIIDNTITDDSADIRIPGIEQIKDIIRKINTNQIPTAEDFALINQSSGIYSQLAMVMVGINISLPGEEDTTSLWQERLRILQQILDSKSISAQAREQLQGIIAEEQTLTEQLGTKTAATSAQADTPANFTEIDTLSQQAAYLADFYFVDENHSIVSESELSPESRQKLALIRRIAAIFEVNVELRNIQSAYYTRGTIVINPNKLSDRNFDSLVETIVHELAHHVERKWQESDIGRTPTSFWTHQRDGIFGDAYKTVLNRILRNYPQLE